MSDKLTLEEIWDKMQQNKKLQKEELLSKYEEELKIKQKHRDLIREFNSMAIRISNTSLSTGSNQNSLLDALLLSSGDTIILNDGSILIK